MLGNMLSIPVPATAIILLMSGTSSIDFAMAAFFAGYLLLRERLHVKSLDRRSHQ